MAEKWIVFDMTDERRKQYVGVADKVMELCMAELSTPLEAYAVLIMCLDGLKEIYDIRDSRMLPNATETKQ